jgi:predicted dinucleotide-binding enzyme
MNIGIIGTGTMGLALGKLWVGRGHQVLLGSRDPRKATTLAETLGPNARGGSIAEAGEFGEAVLLATPWEATQDAVTAAGDLSGKILIDCTNPLVSDWPQLAVGHSTSGAEEIAKWAPGASVVKAFNAIFGRVINSGAPTFASQPATVFYCGDDEAAEAAVAELIEEIGFEPVDAGPLENARYLEPLGELLVQLAYDLAMGTNIAIQLVRR